MASSGEIEKLERRWAENQLGLTFAPLAEAYRKAGDAARALQLLQVGMAQHPNYIPAHIVRGRCYFDLQSDAEAELCFLRVSELDPENVIALKSLAEISERAGRLPEALRRLEMLLDIDRNNEEARGQLDRVRELREELNAAPVVHPVATREVATPPEPATQIPVMELDEEPTFVAASEPSEPMEPLDSPIFSGLSAASEPVEPSTAAAPVFGEFQLRNDSETLLPSDDRLEDVVLSEGTELEVRDAAGDEQDRESYVMSVGDFSSSMAYEPPPPPAQHDEPVEEAVVEAAPPEPVPEPEEAVQEPEAVPEEWRSEASPVVLEVPVPLVDVQPPPPAADSFDAFIPPVSSPAPEPEAPSETEDTDVPAPAGEPELVVTETMAEIFLRQGHRELALAVYTQLSLREPGNGRVAAAAAALQQELAPPAPPSSPPEPEPRFAASDTGGRSVHSFFGALLSASRPAVPTAIHPPAFEPPRRPGGEPTRPAQDALSLSAVFGDEAAPSGPAAAPPDSAVEPSFDEFFAPGASAESELPKPPGTEPAAASQVPEDLEQFNAWLRGLKR